MVLARTHRVFLLEVIGGIELYFDALVDGLTCAGGFVTPGSRSVVECGAQGREVKILGEAGRALALCGLNLYARPKGGDCADGTWTRSGLRHIAARGKEETWWEAPTDTIQVQESEGEQQEEALVPWDPPSQQNGEEHSEVTEEVPATSAAPSPDPIWGSFGPPYGCEEIVPQPVADIPAKAKPKEKAKAKALAPKPKLLAITGY